MDCEVSFIAEAAVELGIDFGFLHIVSDTLDEPHEENLSNEESDIIVTKQKGLYEEIVKVLIVFMDAI